jgi:histidinol dehydrogenase
VAADLLAQAEHDPRAAAILVTDDDRLVRDVGAEITEQLASLATAETARRSLETFGTAFVVDSLDEGADLADRIAPEHLQLVGHRAESMADRPWAAGAIFVGRSTPEVFGDYIAGPSHVLPTCGAARFQSALGVEDFVRRSHLVRFTPEAARRWGRSAAAIASAEGLPAHAEAARRRMP